MRSGTKMKMLVLGFDGASPILIDRWIGDLPTFKMFRNRGILGQTIPPTPAQTPVAWTTFMTGNNPGSHGIFSFAIRKKGTYERIIVRPNMVRSKTLWKIISEKGKKVGVINVPMSDVEDVKGFIVSGFLAKDEGTPYPKAIREKIRQRFGIDKIVGDLEVETLENVESNPDMFFERVNQITDDMADICLYLLEEEKCDLFTTVFMAMDRIQHFFWKNIDENHPRYEKNEYSTHVKEIYVKADKIISRFVKSVEEDTIVMVLSDHGFCPVHDEVFVNNYLEELGILRVKDGNIDLENSRAVSYGYGDIWLNVKGREPHGKIQPGIEYESAREEIIDGLKKVEIDGKKPFKDVKKREDVYWGSCLDEAPDLMGIFNVGWQAARRPEIVRKSESKRYVNDNPRWSGGHDGTHDPNDVPGILAMLGSRVQRKDVRANLWDLAPTILDAMGIPASSSMDGKTLKII